jgi:hypothetical protein
MKIRNSGAGLLFIILGAVLLAANLGAFSLLRFWPLLIVGLGVSFFLMWFGERGNYGLLMPAAVMTVVGLLFLYCEIDGWQHMEDLWPVFMLAPGLGFILMYLFGTQDKGLLVPGGMMLFMGILFLSVNRLTGRWWPLLLIVVGIVLLLIRPQDKELFDATPEGGLSTEPEVYEPPPEPVPTDPESEDEPTESERE